MPTVFLLFIGLLELSVSVPDCDWAYLGGEFIALNVCQQELQQNEHTPTSYVIQCNQEANGLQNRYYMQSETCDESTYSLVEPISALTAQDRFDCLHSSKIPCNDHLYLIYRTYACLPNSTNVSYRDYNLITNTCLGDPTSQTSQYITCTASSYSITTYSGIQCQDAKQRSVETIDNDDCMQILYCPDSIIDPTSYYSTEAPPNTNRCKFINYDGSGHRIDTCHINRINSEIYSYQYHCNEVGDAVIYNYYYNTGECDNDPLISMPITDENVIDFKCEMNPDTTCNASDYMQLRVYTVDGGCDAHDLRTFEEPRMSEYAVVDLVVGQCLQDITGKYCMYECNNNANDGYWTVAYYNNSDCSGAPLPNATVRYNDIDCYRHRVSHMIWCDGIHNITYNDTDTPPYVMDCNYFIDDYIGRPLGICADHRIGSTHYSFQYKCNAFKSGIEKHWYKNAGCKANKLDWIEFTEYDEFYCDSVHTCDDHMLVAKHYTNASCNISDEFYYTDYIIVDQCWPIGDAHADYQTFSKVTCDEHSYVTTLYTNPECNENAQFRSIQYDINDVCLWSKNHIEVTHCPNWQNTTWHPPVIETTPSPVDRDDALDCKWINMNGNARRIDVCSIAPYGAVKWSYRYECKPNGEGVVQNWFRQSDDCNSTDTFTRDVTADATSYNCDSDQICAHFVRIMTYDSHGCEEAEQKFVTSESIIDACFADDYNESTLIKCDPNGNGYVIYEYHDAYCSDEYLWKVTPIAHRLCQPTTQRVEVVEQCVSAPVDQTPPEQNVINFTECNYFYNGLFGVPLDVCHVYKKVDHYTSVMYKCNEAHDAVIQYQYAGSECDQATQIGADETSYTAFYCEADDVCDGISILQMKWYENDSCNTDEKYWGQSTTLMNTCWPNVEDNTSAVILCDGDNYIYYRYDNMFCNEPFFASVEYRSGDCVDGNTFIIESGCLECHYWISTDGYGYPIDHCFAMTDSSSAEHVYQSFKFECNAQYNEIHQRWYKDTQCEDEDETDSQRIPMDNVLDIRFVEPQSTALQLLTLKLYHNTECAEDDTDWSQDIILINQCLPSQDGHSRMVTCSTDTMDAESSFTVQTFEDANCIHLSNETRIESGDCDENGVKIEIINCDHPPSPTSDPTTRIPTPDPTSMAPTHKLSFPPTRQEDKDKDFEEMKTEPVCVNLFGGGNVGRYNCHEIEAFIWLIIAVVAISVGCCCAYAFCNRSKRHYCLYGPTTKEYEDGDDDSGENTYDEDNTRDHPRIMINPSGLHNMISPIRKYNLSSYTPQSAKISADSESDSHDALEDDEEDQMHMDPLEDNIPNPYTISSFNPGTGPSADSGPSGSRPSHHITLTEDDLISTKRVGSSTNPHTMSSEVHIHNHGVPSHLIGRTIEIDNIPIDIMAGVDMSAMRDSMGSAEQLPSTSTSQIQSPQRPVPLTQPSQPQEALLASGHVANKSSGTDVAGIVDHYIRNESFFDTTNTGTRSSDQYHTQHSRDNAMDLHKNRDNIAHGVVPSGLDQFTMNDINDDEEDKEESKEIFKRERHASDTEDNDKTGSREHKGIMVSVLGQSMNESSRTRTYAVDDGIDHTLNPNDLLRVDAQDPSDPSKSRTPMQYDSNQLIVTGSCGGLHRADSILSPGARYRARLRADEEGDDDEDSDDEDDDQRLASLPRHDRHSNVMHVTNNSLIDPMMRTPISHGALMHSEDSADDEEEERGREDTGTLTSALAHSVTTGVVENIDDDPQGDNDEIHYYEPPHASSNGTVHDL